MELTLKMMQIASSPEGALVIILAAAGGGLFGSIIGLWQLRKSISAQAMALRAQTRATELQAFMGMNMKFLDIQEKFEEHINDQNTSLKDLSPVEKRAIDRYFYLANMEYILYKEKVIDEGLSKQWICGISSGVRRKAFAERWESTAKKFTLDDDFRKFVQEHVGKGVQQ